LVATHHAAKLSRIRAPVSARVEESFMKLRVRFRSSRARVLPLDDVIVQARRHGGQPGDDPLGRPFAIVEALDERACVSWRAYCNDAAALDALVGRLQAERAARKQ
jgi:hypothetical protein